MAEQPLDGSLDDLACRLWLPQCESVGDELTDELVVHILRNIRAAQVERTIAEGEVPEKFALFLRDTGAGGCGALDAPEPALE